jgi:hypothetical protein
MRMWLRGVFLALGLAGAVCAADWGPMGFLVGKWAGEGDGSPGAGAGAFSFTADVQGKVLIRKSYAEYPATNGRPAFRHDDLTIVYREDGELRAIYFDNEDHVIRYTIEAAPDGVRFVSDSAAKGPRFRLTYTSTGKDTLKLKFEIATPGKDFSPYIEAKAHRER